MQKKRLANLKTEWKNPYKLKLKKKKKKLGKKK